MIRSAKQYEVTKQKVDTLRAAVDAPQRADLPAALDRAARGQTAELISELETEMREFKQLQGTPVQDIPIHSLRDLQIAPIRYRIAAHMTIEAFAHYVNVHSRQIARYEKEDYQNVSAETLRSILERLHLKIEGKLEVDRTSIG